jgi:signal transduction histidine kinase
MAERAVPVAGTGRSLPVRAVLLGAVVAVVLVVVALGWALLTGPALAGVVGPFVAAAVAVAAARVAGPFVDRVAGRLTPRPAPTPYAVLADTAARVRSGSLGDALPGLARVLGEGTAAERAVVWLVVDDVLVAEAVFPPGEGAGERVPSLAALLDRPGIDHAVPVLDGARLRAVLTIAKAGRPVTPGDRRLVRDVAGGAQLVLQGVARGAELSARVRRVDELVAETAASRRRLEVAREVERRRLVTELRGATADRLAGFRQSITDGAEALEDAEDDPEGATEMARHHVGEARERLSELIDRFRVIARGVHPAVLREQGPRAALEEVIADLPRPVHLSGRLAERLPWEIESGLYYVAASAVSLMAAEGGRSPLEVFLERRGDTVGIRIEDTDGQEDTDVAALRAALADDVDRLAALGGTLDVADHGGGHVELRAWLPDRLRPVVLDGAQRAGVAS